MPDSTTPITQTDSSAPGVGARRNIGNAGSPTNLLEKTFQGRIANHLVDMDGWRLGADTEVNTTNALLPSDLVTFIQDTQPAAWDHFSRLSNPEGELSLAVSREIQRRGAFDVLRNGIPEAGSRPAIRLAYPEPVSDRNPDARTLYEQNRFTVVKELHYEKVPATAGRIDLAAFLNGIPLFAAELKNETTGSVLAHAEHQWKTTRDPREPLLSPTSGFLVYFAVSHSLASFTTRLDGRSTKFLPFNQGDDNRAGNPPGDTDACGYRTYYLWHDVWTKRSLLHLLFNFMHVDTDTGSLVFPRYHQRDFIRKAAAAISSTPGLGQSYLVQHSAGSGKTKSIAWLAHLAGSSHLPGGETTFDRVLVITDRKVVDRQLQAAVDSLASQPGSVGVVDKNTRQLRSFIEQGKRVIVCTVQKFSYLREILATAAGDRAHRYAVIIDEAHSGQTGQHGENLREALDSLTLLDEIAEAGLPSGANITYFAFTATPRQETLERFSHDGQPFHLYSMRQAIEEGFILDVLANYRRIQVQAQLEYSGDDQTLPSRREASRALTSLVRGDDAILREKARIALDMIVGQVLGNANGHGKAMIVADSRLGVCRWNDAVKAVMASDPEKYARIKTLVAFTGSLTYNEQAGITDETINGIPESQIADKFHNECNVLIVASKFQTGFNEPALCAQFLDRKVTGVTAVQTLSRCNRTKEGKSNVLIVDFQDNAEEVRKAFAAYHVDTAFDPDREVTLAGLTATAARIYTYGLFTARQAADYATARRDLVQDESNQAAEKQVRDITLHVASTVAALDQTAPARLAEFKAIAQDYLSDCMFYSQTSRISDPRLLSLRSVLKMSLLLTAVPRPASDREWLDHVTVTMTGLDTIDEDMALGQPEQTPSTAQPSSETGIRTRNPDSPITVSELIDEWNARYAHLVMQAANTLGSRILSPTAGNPDEPAPASTDPHTHEILAALARAAGPSSQLAAHARDKSYDMFADTAGKVLAADLVLPTLMPLLRTNPRTKAFLKAYSEDPVFTDGLLRFLLDIAYGQPAEAPVAPMDAS